MRLRQSTGGIAALIAAATFVVGFAMAVTALSDYAAGNLTAADSAAFVAENQGLLTIWYVVIFVAFGIALVPLVLVLYDRLRHRESALARTAAVFGVIWSGLVIASGMIATVSLGTIADLNETDSAGAATAWSAIDAVQHGIGGGVEVVGGIWVLLVSWAALRTGALPRALAYVGIAAGAAAMVTIVPALEPVGAIFGIGMIIWFAWGGTILLRDQETSAGTVRPAVA